MCIWTHARKKHILSRTR